MLTSIYNSENSEGKLSYVPLAFILFFTSIVLLAYQFNVWESRLFFRTDHRKTNNRTLHAEGASCSEHLSALISKPEAPIAHRPGDDGTAIEAITSKVVENNADRKTLTP